MKLRALKLLLVIGLAALPTYIIAQSKPAAPFEPASSLNDQQKRGKHIFLQRCSLCHLAKYTKAANWTEATAPPPIGPRLSGLLKSANTDKERSVREFIRKGTQNMPGWQYALDAREMDDLIAYMKIFIGE